MNTGTRRSRQLNFKNLPLIEAAVRVSLEEPLQLTFSTINAVHEKIKAEFPQLSEPDRIEAPPGIKGTVEIRPGAILGATHAGHSEGLCLTIQPQVIGARWLKRRESSAPEYPHFSKLRDAHWSYFDACKDVLAEELRVAVVNMFYINLIRRSDSSMTLDAYIAPDAQIGLLAKRKLRAIRKVEFAWQEDDQIDLRFALEEVTVEAEGQASDAFKLTTASGVKLADYQDPDPKTALEHIHERMQSFFVTIISDKAKSEWGLGESGG